MLFTNNCDLFLLFPSFNFTTFFKVHYLPLLYDFVLHFLVKDR